MQLASLMKGMAPVVEAYGEVVGGLGSPFLLDKSGPNLDGLLVVADGVGQFAWAGESNAALVA